MTAARIRFSAAAGALYLLGIGLAYAQPAPKLQDAVTQVRISLNAAKGRIDATAQAVAGAFALLGKKDPALAASVVIEVTAEENLPPSDIGRALAGVALARAAVDPAGTASIARTIGDEGVGDMGQVFAAAVEAGGNPHGLASLAVAPPRLTPEPPGRLVARLETVLPPPCKKPSCS